MKERGRFTALLLSLGRAHYMTTSQNQQGAFELAVICCDSLTRIKLMDA
jgi:hypothetical protein